MNLHSLRQGLGVSAVALSRYMAALTTVMLLVHEMVPCSECHQPGVVRRGRDGDRAGAAHVGMAQLVREDLQFIRGEPVVIPEHIVMGWPARTLNACMTAQVEVELKGVGDICVHCCSCWDVPTLPNPLVLVCTEETGVMPFLDDNVGDARLVILFQFDAGISDC